MNSISVTSQDTETLLLDGIFRVVLHVKVRTQANFFQSVWYFSYLPGDIWILSLHIHIIAIFIKKIKECNNYTCWLMNMLYKHCIVRCMYCHYNIIQNTFFMDLSQTSHRPLPDFSWTSPRLLTNLSQTSSWTSQTSQGPLLDFSWTLLDLFHTSF